MGDLSETELKLPLATFRDMERRVSEYIANEKTDPKIVYLNIENKNDFVSYEKFLDMKTRVEQWIKNKPNEPLNIVWINKPRDASTPSTDSTTSSGAADNLPTVNIKGKEYTPKNFTEFYMLMGSFGYSEYNNDKWTLSQEIENLSKGVAMNCSDFSQLGVSIANQFKKNGKAIYETKYVHIDCSPKVGHAIFQIRGGEFENWTMVDIAAKASKSSRVYPIGDYWCKGKKIRGYNEVWIMKDDGKMP